MDTVSGCTSGGHPPITDRKPTQRRGVTRPTDGRRRRVTVRVSSSSPPASVAPVFDPTRVITGCPSTDLPTYVSTTSPRPSTTRVPTTVRPVGPPARVTGPTGFLVYTGRGVSV